jgi:hypothetical protein
MNNGGHELNNLGIEIHIKSEVIQERDAPVDHVVIHIAFRDSILIGHVPETELNSFALAHSANVVVRVHHFANDIQRNDSNLAS